jgi:hypothetical protein
MTQLACWVLFGAVLVIVSLGCGLLLERAAGLRLAAPLLLPAGLAVLIDVAEVMTKWSAIARFTTPVVIVVALVGFAIGRPRQLRSRLSRWPIVAAVAVYVVYLAPVLATGKPTFTGYIKLDDTATWMAMIDRALGHGHSLAGLAPSTYEATLSSYLNGGEPVGALLPWGIGHQLVGQDVAWVFQPYLAFLGAMVALAVWPLVTPLVRSPRLRALVVFIAAQSALIYGYSLWGGIKEVAATAMLPLIVACAVPVFEQRARLRSFLPLAAACFGMLSALAFGGAVWLVVVLIVVALFSLRTWIRSVNRLRLVALVAAGTAVAVGLILGGRSFVNANGALTGEELGNLLHPLNGFQLFGIWPAADFRIDPPNSPILTFMLIGVVIAAGCLTLAAAWRRRSWALLLYLASAVVGIGLVSAKGSPWVQGKALAIASPAALLAGMVGAALILESRKRARARDRAGRAALTEGARLGIWLLATGAICAGVLWSNIVYYHHVTVAPYAQFRELERIGNKFAGQGPTLINEYQPYGARHFLRSMDPESPSELRRRTIPLLGGGLLAKASYADLDQFQLTSLLVYRTIVIRTSPVASRPPQPYNLVYSGAWYQVWQRPLALKRQVLSAIPMGSSVDPSGVPDCSAVIRTAHATPASGLLAAVSRATPQVMSVPSPLPKHTHAAFVLTSPGLYQVWLGGSFFRRAEASVDGIRAGSSYEQLNEAGEWTPLGRIRLSAAAHRMTLTYGDAGLYPGSGGPGAAGPFFPVGPLAVAPVTAGLPITYVQPSAARSLCGKRWDWIEALGP